MLLKLMREKELPNLVAHLSLISWPLVVILLFKTSTLPYAVSISIVGGYLILPTSVTFDFPLIPALTKDSIPVLTVMAIYLSKSIKKPRKIISRIGAPLTRKYRNREQHQNRIAAYIIISLLISSSFTVFHNREPLIYGPTFLPGLRIYDLFSFSLQSLIEVLPFLLGYSLFYSPREHQILLSVLAISGLLYTLPALFEVRMSPQLNVWIYGFFPHSFAQHVRGDGYRPVVFLQHGLWLGIFFAMSLIAGAAWARSVRKSAFSNLLLFLFIIWMLGAIFLSKSLGALLISIIFLPVALLFSARFQVFFSGLFAAVVLIYPLVRGSDLFPAQFLLDQARKINPLRADSLNFRFVNEDILLQKANEKPWFGWGHWGRNAIYDENSGQKVSVNDGAWIILIGAFGWLGYIIRFGLLALPLVLLRKAKKNREINVASTGLCLVLAVNLIDLLPNATLTPVTWLIGGAVAGYVFRNPTSSVSKKSFDVCGNIKSENISKIRFFRKPRS